MFGSIGGNCGCQVTVWRDKDGKEWAQASTAAAASVFGTEPFKPRWSIAGEFKACRQDPQS